MVKFYIDPGHGGTDPGALGNGFREADLALKIGLEARRILLEEYVGAEVRMSRTTDTYLTLAQRTNDANKWGANYFVSIHLNSATSNAKGYEDFIYNGSVNNATVALQSAIHAEIYAAITKELGATPNRGKKRGNFHVIRESKMPAVLTENLFINSTHDGPLIKKADYVKVLGRAHAVGMAKAAGLKKKTTTSQPSKPTPPPTTSTLYRVRKSANDAQTQIGAYTVKQTAIDLANKRASEGYKVFDSNSKLVHDPKATAAPSNEMYRVRKTWADASSQIGAYSVKQNAVDLANKHAGYKVFNSKGTVVHTSTKK